MPRASSTLLLVLLSSSTLARGWVKLSYPSGGRQRTNLKTRCRAADSSSSSNSNEDDKPASLDVGFFAALKQRQLVIYMCRRSFLITHINIVHDSIVSYDAD